MSPKLTRMTPVRKRSAPTAAQRRRERLAEEELEDGEIGEDARPQAPECEADEAE